MNEAFVPLIPAGAGSHETQFSALAARTSTSNVSPAFPAMSRMGDACGDPVITLQRNGPVVSRIRIQCSCGKVIDLTCAY